MNRAKAHANGTLRMNQNPSSIALLRVGHSQALISEDVAPDKLSRNVKLSQRLVASALPSAVNYCLDVAGFKIWRERNPGLSLDRRPGCVASEAVESECGRSVHSIWPMSRGRKSQARGHPASP